MILYGNEHQVRAANLGAALGENVADVAPLSAGGAIPACADAPLTIWGHGGPTSFAEMTPAQLKTLVQRWRAANSKLTTVELITCDARHTETQNDSYTDALMPLLIAGSKVLVYVKSLPRGGSTAKTSELWAISEVGSDGYYFVAGDNDAALAAGAQIFKDAVAALPATTKPGEKIVKALPIVQAQIAKLAQKGAVRFVSSGGPFSKLRGLLVPVTAYVENGVVKAVPKTLA